MKRAVILTLILFMGCTFCMAQEKYDYQWMVGSSGIVDTSSGGYGTYLLDFNGDSIVFIPLSSFSNTHIISLASICDKDGQLAMYTTGCRMRNNMHEVIDGTGNLNPGWTWDNYCNNYINEHDLSLYPSAHGQLLLPYPGHLNWYFYFSKNKDLSLTNKDDYYETPLAYYTVIDMSANNGKGEVVCLKDKDDPIKPCHTTTKIEYSMRTNEFGVQACKHANGKDWWIMVHGWRSDSWHRLLLTEDGIQGPWEQHIGPLRDTFYTAQSVFSPDGKKYAASCEYQGGVYLFDFDRATGLLSNYKKLTYSTNTDLHPWLLCGVSFSPSSRFLYVNAFNRLYQYDLHSILPQTTLKLVYEYDMSLDEYGNNTNLSYHQLVPDGRIIVTVYGGNNHFYHVINYPDEKYPDCDFKLRGIKLPVWDAQTGPNWPHYRMPPDSTSATQDIVESLLDLKAWYNPRSEEIRIWLQGLKKEGGSGILTMYSIEGRVVHHERIQTIDYQLDHTWFGLELGAGVYVVTWTDARGGSVSDRIVVVK